MKRRASATCGCTPHSRSSCSDTSLLCCTPPSHLPSPLSSPSPPPQTHTSQVRVLGESYTPDDEEDSGEARISNVWLYNARYRVPLPRVYAGNLVLVEGLDALVSKTATVVGLHLDEEVHIFKPLRFQTRRWVCWGGCHVWCIRAFWRRGGGGRGACRWLVGHCA